MELLRYAGAVGYRSVIESPQTRSGSCHHLRRSPSNQPLAQPCGGVDLVRKITTYPVLLSGPLEGKQIHVGRVAVHECLTCGHLMPTPAGQAKVDRNVEMGIRLFLGQLH
jgi:hypothetical protein